MLLRLCNKLFLHGPAPLNTSGVSFNPSCAGFPAGSVPEEASATSCTLNPYRGNFDGSCTAAAGKGKDIFTFILGGQKRICGLICLSCHQAWPWPAPQGTALPIQGPAAGPREAEKVEGPRALRTILKEAETDPMSSQIPPPSHPQQWWQSYFLYWWIVGSVFFLCFLLFPFFKTSSCRFLNKTDL